jgi:hypothetical protein
MPCLLGFGAFFFPRIILLLVWLFSTYLNNAYSSFIWLILGFIFLPTTTLAYAWAFNTGGGNVSGIGIVVIGLAVLFDLGSIGGGGKAVQHKSR